LNEENKITIKYQCKHVEDKYIINPKNIKNYKSKCCECDNDICIFIKIIFALIANTYYVVNACRITLINA